MKTDMGKDYSTATYKKNYEGDYLKSYKDSAAQKTLLEERTREYERVSKKQDTAPYKKSEKAKYDTAWNDTLNTPTKSTKVPQATQYKKEATNKSTVKQQPPKYQKTASSQSKKEIIPPPYLTDSKQPIAKQTNVKRDYSYIDRNSLKHPVVVSGHGLYKNIYNDEQVDEQEARNILYYAGYRPKKLMNLLYTCIIALALSLFMSVVGPIFVAIWGYTVLNQKTIQHVKITANGSKMFFQMPVTEEEQGVFRMRGIIYMFIGAGGAIVQLVKYISSLQ